MAGEMSRSSHEEVDQERRGGAVETVHGTGNIQNDHWSEEQLINSFRVLVERHQRRQTRRNQIMLG